MRPDLKKLFDRYRGLADKAELDLARILYRCLLLESRLGEAPQRAASAS